MRKVESLKSVKVESRDAMLASESGKVKSLELGGRIWAHVRPERAV